MKNRVFGDEGDQAKGPKVRKMELSVENPCPRTREGVPAWAPHHPGVVMVLRQAMGEMGPVIGQLVAGCAAGFQAMHAKARNLESYRLEDEPGKLLVPVCGSPVELRKPEVLAPPPECKGDPFVSMWLVFDENAGREIGDGHDNPHAGELLALLAKAGLGTKEPGIKLRVQTHNEEAEWELNGQGSFYLIPLWFHLRTGPDPRLLSLREYLSMTVPRRLHLQCNDASDERGVN